MIKFRPVMHASCMESGSTRVTLLTFVAPPDDGDAAPPHDHLVLVEDKWPIV